MLSVCRVQRCVVWRAAAAPPLTSFIAVLAVHLSMQACKQTLAAKRSLAHEWKMFRDIATLGEDFPAARSHFLQVRPVWWCSVKQPA
jgi:gamma-glutamylcysteine synthetase